MARASEASPRWLAALLSGALALPPGRAAAEPPAEEIELDDSHKATAQQLFEEGLALMKEGEVASACHNFAESQRLDPAIGTRFNLADCYERLGKLASAWVHYVGVADAAERAGQMDRGQFARARAERLEPQLARMRVVVDRPPDGMVVVRDGVEVGPAQWDKGVPVDRGRHMLEARAPDHETWRSEVEVDEDGQTLIVEIPHLVRRRVPPPKPRTNPVVREPSDADGKRRLGPRHIAGITLGGLGVIGLSIGGGFGIVAKQKKDDADARCPRDGACFADGAELLREARRAGNVSTAMFVVGGVLLATGIVLLATAHLGKKSRKRSARSDRSRGR